MHISCGFCVTNRHSFLKLLLFVDDFLQLCVAVHSE